MIREINRPVEGAPVLLLPGGELVRWPRHLPLPQIGEVFKGTAVMVREDQRQAVDDLLRGNVLQRCDAAQTLPIEIVRAFCSYSAAMNLRRVSQRLCPRLREHVTGLLQSGHEVPLKVLIRVAAETNEGEQLAIWNQAMG